MTLENFDNRCASGKWWSFSEGKCVETHFTPKVEWFNFPDESDEETPKSNDRFWIMVLMVFLLLGILYGFFKYKPNTNE